EPRIDGGLLGQHGSLPATNSLDLHSRLDGHTRPQQMVRILTLVEPNSHGESLHHFHVVPGRIFRRKEAEERASGARKAVNFGLVVAPEGINADCDRLTRSHSSELRLFEVRRDPDIVQGNDYEQALPRLHVMTKLHSLSPDHAADRSVNLGIAEVEFSGAQIGARLLQMSRGRL